MALPPSGNVAFLFTDIEGSTKLWEYHSAQMRPALARHDAILREASERHGGYVFKTIGDAFCVAFPCPADALDAAIASQRALADEDWGSITIKVRMALHAGDCESRDGDYFGQPLNRVARLRDAGHGGQIIVTQEILDTIFPPPIDVEFLDRGEHRLKDLAQPEHIYQAVADGLGRDFPALRTLSSHPNNLPADTTSFVGREREVREVRELIEQPDVRLVTLQGLGGCGKTRLALQVAESMLELFPQGVWYADLTPLNDPTLVIPTIARACGLEEDPSKTRMEQLIDHLKSAKAMLVIDNFEHVEDAADDVATLLKSCSSLKLLVTSRVLLNLSMEHEYEVPPLRPDESVSLFAARARQVRAGFAVSDENRADVETICRELDGIPLSVELAAAQIRQLSPVEIAQALHQRLEVLSTKMRDLPQRHRSLRGAIDWSYDLLKEPERALFRSLSVFAGGFTAEASDAVCGQDCHGGDETYALLTALREKSLVRLEREGDKRFTLLESLRQYGAERLQETGDTCEMRRRHLTWFQGLAESAEGKLRGPEQAEWLERLDVEHGNIRSALDFSMQAAPDAAMRVAGSLWRFWQSRSYFREGRDWLDRALKAAGHDDPSPERAKALYAAGVLSNVLDDYEAAANFLIESINISRTNRDLRGAAQALNTLGNVNWRRGDYETATILYRESLYIERERGDKAGIARSLVSIGNVASKQSDFQKALRLYQEALEYNRATGNKTLESAILHNIGDAYWFLGEFEKAREPNEQSLEIRRELGDKVSVARSLSNLGNIAVKEGRYADAERLYDEALTTTREMGDRSWEAITLKNAGDAALAAGDFDRARGRFRESLVIRRDVDDHWGIADCINSLALLATREGCFERAARLYGISEAMRERIQAALTPFELPDYELSVTLLAEKLGEESFNKLRQSVRGANASQAVTYALSDR